MQSIKLKKGGRRDSSPRSEQHETPVRHHRGAENNEDVVLFLNLCAPKR